MSRFDPIQVYEILERGFRCLDSSSDYRLVEQETSQSPLDDRAYTAYAVQFDSSKNKRSVRLSLVDYGKVIRMRIRISNTEPGTTSLSIDTESSADFGLRDEGRLMQFNASNIQELNLKIEELFEKVAARKLLDGIIQGKTWRMQAVDWGNYR